MDKNIFKDVAQMFCDYICDGYDSGLKSAPDKLYTKSGYLKMFKEWLEENENEYESFRHVLEHFDEVSVEEFDPEDEPGIFIPVLK